MQGNSKQLKTLIDKALFYNKLKQENTLKKISSSIISEIFQKSPELIPYLYDEKKFYSKISESINSVIQNIKQICGSEEIYKETISYIDTYDYNNTICTD
jgi:hypothetical protein